MRDNLFSFLHKLGIPGLLRLYKQNHLTVLTLHRISIERDYFFDAVSPELFESLLKYVTTYYEVISFAELADAQKKAKKPLLILSFDDGYYDFMEYALPLLKKYNLPSNHNLVNSCLNANQMIWTQRLNCAFSYLREHGITQDSTITDLLQEKFDGRNWHGYYLKFLKCMLDYNMSDKLDILANLEQRYGVNCNYRMLNWSDAEELLKENVEIGSHTYNHESLNQINSMDVLEREILRSKTEMESKLKTPIHIIAFPNGQYNHTVLDYCKEIGFKYILLLDDKASKLDNFDINQNGNVISRIGIASESTKEAVLRVELFHPFFRKLKNVMGMHILGFFYVLFLQNSWAFADC